MTRWVCFDEPAAAAVRQAGGAPAMHQGDALMAATQRPANSVVIMPTRNAQELAVVSVIRRDKIAAPVIELAKPARTGQATGFLGLTDEPEYEDEPQAKPWWKRS
jgi:hypothetical protein